MRGTGYDIRRMLVSDSDRSLTEIDADGSRRSRVLTTQAHLRAVQDHKGTLQVLARPPGVSQTQ
jgi:hypothetical protein